MRRAPQPRVTSRIEDYALLGDCQTAALVGKDGSIDWLCLPRFDSAACFAAILGTRDNGRWVVAPRGEVTRVTRAYRDGSMILDTTFETSDATVVVTDFMPRRDGPPHVIRIVRGVRGTMAMATELVVRFDYGSIVPWVQKTRDGVRAIAGPDSIRLQSDVPLRGENLTTVAEFDVAKGDTVSFVLTWYPSHVDDPEAVDALGILAETETTWSAWSSQCKYDGDWRPIVHRSLVTLKALTHTETGGIVAAPTTSLPEAIGGPRNWDYRFCWVRDATFTLLSLIHNGFLDEACSWREWLLRAVAGDPSQLQIMYGVDGKRRLSEEALPWLGGYESSRPVRVGNAAYGQRQLDVYGEVMDALYQCHVQGLPPQSDAWNIQRKMMEFLETIWREPDEGIWEVRGPPRQFTHSKVMAWVAIDRAVRTVEAQRCDDDGERLARWRALRAQMHDEICRNSFDPELDTFVQSYGSKRLDASVLMIPLVGFLPATDPRMRGTVAAIEKHLMREGFVRRYDTDPAVDGLPEGEGVFLPCSFWLADNWALLGRKADARRMFERLVGLCNDVGLLSEEYDVAGQRQLGNFPQAFSHVSLVNTARNLGHATGDHRPRRHES